MKKLGFLLVGSAALALSACGSNEADTLNEAEAQNMESEALNNLAAEAANAEIEALGVRAVVADTLMTDARVAAALARDTLAAVA